MGQSKIILSCENPNCRQEFSKLLTEFRRSEKLGRQHFCSIRCFAQFKGIANFKDRINTDTSHLKNIIRRDDFSPFRNYLKFIKKSVKQRNKAANLTLEDLKIVWEQQRGICPYTGWNLILFPCTTDYKSTILTPKRASVDRINSSKGYTIDNIQFVAVIANLAKNAFIEQELLDFCNAVTIFISSEYKQYIYILDSEHDCNKDLLLLQFESSRHNNRRDEYSAFRQHLKLARRRAREKNRECSITLPYLKALWEKQGGCCPYTGWELDNPKTTQDWDYYRLHPRRASLDRIDSSLGYIPGNVQFVAVIANYAKNDFHEKILLEFCKAVVDYRIKNY